MKRVSWPSMAELKESTIVVLVTVTVITVFLFAVDKILDLGIKQIISLGLTGEATARTPELPWRWDRCPIFGVYLCRIHGPDLDAEPARPKSDGAKDRAGNEPCGTDETTDEQRRGSRRSGDVRATRMSRLTRPSDR